MLRMFLGILGRRCRSSCELEDEIFCFALMKRDDY
jgi:hypothetical protein